VKNQQQQLNRKLDVNDGYDRHHVGGRRKEEETLVQERESALPRVILSMDSQMVN